MTPREAEIGSRPRSPGPSCVDLKVDALELKVGAHDE
jgi:hypothetical protein